MRNIDAHLKRIRAVLKRTIEVRGFTQVEVQEMLGWGRRYISQLVTARKTMHVDQVLAILNVIGVDPGDFFGEVYGFDPSPEPKARHAKAPRRGRPRRPRPGPTDALLQDFACLQRQLHGLVAALMKKSLITAEELKDAAAKFRPASTDGRR